jgi:tetratricopeptide (TPR) repeat protein
MIPFSNNVYTYPFILPLYPRLSSRFQEEEQETVEDVDNESKNVNRAAARADEEEEEAPAPTPVETVPDKPPAEMTAEEAAAAAAAAAREALKQEFSDVTRKGTKLMKANAFDRAATQFGRAIEIAEELDMPQSSLETLYNNRAAMFEKAGMLDASLEDCTVVLAMNAAHIKVRKRRARIYQAQGRVQDALVEYCAVLVADTVDMKRKLEPFKNHPEVFARQQQALMQEKGEEQTAVQEKLQELMTLCGKAKADEVMKAREADPSLLSNTGITSESSVFQLLLSYSEYLEEEASSGAADVNALTEAVKAANSSDDNR